MQLGLSWHPTLSHTAITLGQVYCDYWMINAIPFVWFMRHCHLYGYMRKGEMANIHLKINSLLIMSIYDL